jgi:hypothetical protein
MMKKIRWLLPALALAAAGASVQPTSVAAQVTSWDAANDFSLTSNPNGAWSYGWSESRGSTFQMLSSTEDYVGSGFDIWEESKDLPLPFVGHNGTSTAAVFYTAVVPAGAMALHPGFFGENAIVRWTAPAAGTYSASATFIGRDSYAGTTTDVATLVRGTQVWTADVNGYLDTRDYSSTSVVLAAGDTIDFTVGQGADGSYLYDTTGFSAQIALVGPAPTYTIGALFDQSKAVRAGATAPIKLVLYDANGNDVSSPAIVVTATGLTQISTNAAGAVASPGDSNPDSNFRFTSTLGPSGGYIFNLSTRGLSTGTYRLDFVATGDPTVHSVTFEVR